ncbi:CoA transferase [Pseudorhodoferax sp. LjRoot39]|uniref:CaiB/BaiF CoA transferase family protein n=1 Tax=Pseudorhodoferax sp. LjRoot39 TaxID=3342328 RepID=UPI003ED0C44F
MAGPLAGLRILDLTSVLMGPFATQILGDLGAEVTKIEPPEGDPVRHLGPWRHPGMSACFLHVNRNKRSVVLDLKKPEDRASVLALAAQTEVFVTNVRPAAMARLRLSYEEVAAVHPGIIYVALVGYGQDGPYADRAAYDDMIQAVCAIPSLIAQVGDGVPRYVPLAIVDRIVGQAAATAILAAFVHKQRTGRGQYVEVPMFETMAPYVLAEHLSGHTYVPPIGEPGYLRLLASSRQAYATRDGHVCTIVYTDKQWRSFFQLIGQPERCSTDPRLADIASRTRHISDLYADVAAALKNETTAYWLEALARADIPVMPLHTLHSIQNDPHLKAVNFFREVEHPTEGRMVELAPIGRWSDSPPDAPSPAPTLGQHTAEILGAVSGCAVLAP